MKEKYPEKWIEAQLKKMIEHRGGVCLKFVSPGTTGVMDRIILMPGGRVLFVELKQRIGRTSGMQDYWIGRFRELGAEVYLVKGWENTKKFIEEVIDA